MSQEREFAKILLEILTTGEPEKEYGICSLVDKELSKLILDWHKRSEIGVKLRRCFRCWPKASGNYNYPVCDPDLPNDAQAAKDIYQNTIDLWEGAYGDLRKELLQFIIDGLRKEIEE